MISFSDVLNVFDKWKSWKRIKAVPDRIDALEERLKRLEYKLGDNRPENLCDKCRAYTLEPNGRFVELKGNRFAVWECSVCFTRHERKVK